MSLAGYSSDLFVPALDRSLTCAICMEVLRDPSQCPNGHLFCRNCILAAIEYRRQCPTCRCFLDRVNLSLSLLARDVIGKSRVRCSLGKDQPDGVVSCNWKGPLNHLPNHIEDDCPLEVVVCSMHNCPFRAPRHSMTAHLQRCPYRCKECPYCGKNF